MFVKNPTVNIKTFLGLVILRWFLISAYFKLYANLVSKDSVPHFSQFYKSCFVSILFTVLHLDSAISTKVLLSKPVLVPIIEYFILFIVASTAIRLGYFLLRRRFRVQLAPEINTIIVGSNGFTNKLIQNPLFIENAGIKGVYNISETTFPRLTYGKMLAAKRLLGVKNLETVLICENALGHHKFDDVMHVANRHMIRIYLIPDLKGVDLTHSTVISYNGIPIIKPMTEPLESINNRIIKRAFDIAFSLVVIIGVLSWLTPILALLIYFQDRGPVFFKQKRSGYKNQEFMCFKFRSMTVNKQADIQIATRNDLRITKLGAFLRKSSIDELPQFINVLKGEMSVCGPRPHMVSQTFLYSEEVRKYMVRHFVMPGITGWAQVMGARGEISRKEDMENRVEKDIYYIQNWSLLLDLKIIFLTVFNVFKGDKQAY